MMRCVGVVEPSTLWESGAVDGSQVGAARSKARHQPWSSESGAGSYVRAEGDALSVSGQPRQGRGAGPVPAGEVLRAPQGGGWATKGRKGRAEWPGPWPVQEVRAWRSRAQHAGMLQRPGREANTRSRVGSGAAASVVRVGSQEVGKNCLEARAEGDVLCQGRCHERAGYRSPCRSAKNREPRRGGESWPRRAGK